MSISAIEQTVRALVQVTGELEPENVRLRPFVGPAPETLHATVRLEAVQPAGPGKGTTDHIDDDGNLTVYKRRTAGLRVTWRNAGARDAADRFEAALEHEVARRIMEQRGYNIGNVSQIRMAHPTSESDPFIEEAMLTLDVAYNRAVTLPVGCIEAVEIAIGLSVDDAVTVAGTAVGTPVPEGA